MSKISLKSKKVDKKSITSTMSVEVVNPHAAGIDVGSRFHVVAVGQVRGRNPVIWCYNLRFA